MKEVILILGGSAGIGEAIAKDLSNNYKKQVIIVGRNEDKMEIIAKENRNIQYFKSDISKEEEINGLVEFLKENYIIEGIINSATVQNLSLLKDVTDEKGKNIIYKFNK